MSGFLVFMIMVSCSDGLNDCQVADDLKAYSTIEQCNQDLAPSVKKISMRGEEIFGRCILASTDLMVSDITVNWHVDQRGDFFVDIADEDAPRLNPSMVNLQLPQLGKPAA